MAGELEDHPGAANGHATDEEERKSRKLPAPCLLPRPHSEAFEDEEAQQQVDGAPLLGGARELVTAAKDLAASSSTRARELSASVAQTTKTISLSTWAIFLRDWGESYEASFDLITLWLCPSCFRLLDEKEQHRHWSILWNPVFWAMHLPLVFCILSGKWLHTLWGQGDKVREDENMEENRVRTHWIYCLDGPIAGLCILDLLDAVLDVPMYSQRKFQDSLLSWCMTLTVTIGYVTGNSYFLYVMSRRSLVGVRLVIICQTVFALGLLNMLVAGLMRNKEAGRYGDYFFNTWLELVAWSARLTMVLFMLAAAFVYSRLWNEYRVQPAIREVSFTDHGDYLKAECLQYSVIPLGALLMWTLLGLAYWLDDDLFWDALV